jgi:hypothetical protein
MTDADRQFWQYVIDKLLILAPLLATGYWGYRKSMAATKRNAEKIEVVHQIANSANKSLVDHNNLLQRVISQAVGPEKDKMEQKLSEAPPEQKP